MRTTSNRRWALVLAGGDGTRLHAPTVQRIAPLAEPARTLVIVNENHLHLALPQLAGLVRTNVLVQPRNLDTGPGILLGLAALAARDPDATSPSPFPAGTEDFARCYDRLAPWNFSRDFLARVPRHLLVTRADDLGWSDWSTPEAVERTFASMGWERAWRARELATA